MASLYVSKTTNKQKQTTKTNTMRPIFYFSVRTLDLLSHIDIPGTAAKMITHIYSPLAAFAEDDPLWTLYGFTRPSRIAPWSSSSVVSYMLVSLVLGPSPFASPSDGVGAAIAVVMR